MLMVNTYRSILDKTSLFTSFFKHHASFHRLYKSKTCSKVQVLCDVIKTREPFYLIESKFYLKYKINSNTSIVIIY